MGTSTLAFHFIANLNGEFNSTWAGFSWMPIVGFALIHTGYAIGYGQTVVFVAGEILP